MASSACVTLVVVCLNSITDAAKILAVIPTPSLSHQVIFRPLTQALAQRGHEVIVVTTDPVFTDTKPPTNLTEIDVHDVSYKIWNNEFTYALEFGRRYSIYSQVGTFIKMLKNMVLEQLKTKEIQDLIKYDRQHFDLIIVEAWVRQALVYSHVFRAPVICVSSFGLLMGNEETFGIPINPLKYPLTFQQRLYNLTFMEKLDELYKNWWYQSEWLSKAADEIEAFRGVLGPSLPEYTELYNNADMLFLNTHPIWIDNQPLPSNVISIWGIHKNPENELPHNLKSYLDNSKNGVIYLSFGTNAPSTILSPDFIRILIRVFSKLPYDVLWKWEKDVMPGKPDNVKIGKWFPQSDLLRHPNVKVFITQGGLQSTDEAITAGVPLIGIPMLGDQWYNVEKYEKHKIGVRLDMETLTEDKFEDAIHLVLNDTSFRDNIVKLRTFMNDQPQTAMERAVWWTEYVLRHGGAKHLRAATANKPLWDYYEHVHDGRVG
ncbi:unnamed protein product [Leptosia nina]|uniref:UDP-glucuronosyltransferase n=1 Tax=Leptosia nina TaxID=320188 RepID=A0AAV1JGW7_9NEOP